MTNKDIEKAQSEYSEFWHDRDKHQQQISELAFRAGIVWLLNKVCAMPFDMALKELAELHEDIRE